MFDLLFFQALLVLLNALIRCHRHHLVLKDDIPFFFHTCDILQKFLTL